MSAPDILPTYVWKILPADPQPIQKTIPLSELDRNDGFIHLSTASQVSKTADRFFGDATSLWLLKIPYVGVQDRIKWEGNSQGSFPHIYDADLENALGSKEIEEVLRCDRKSSDTWSVALGSMLK